MAESGEVTRLLALVRQGNGRATRDLFAVLYDELRAIARRELAREQMPLTLRPSDLVHEAYLKLGGDLANASNRLHFLGIAARAMRQVLVDRARRRLAEKRGGGATAVTLENYHGSSGGLNDAELLELDDALEQLDGQERRIVELRFFVGLNEREIAELLAISERTVRRSWVRARARLYHSLYGDAGEGGMDDA